MNSMFLTAIRALEADIQNGYGADWFDRFEELATISTTATCDLKSFKRCVSEIPNESETKLSAIHPSTPDIVTAYVNTLWSHIGGLTDSSRADAVLAAARIEFTRSQLYFILVAIGLFRLDKWSPADQVEIDQVQRAPTELAANPWDSADAIARSGRLNLWFNDMAACDFNDWLALATKSDMSISAHTIRDPSKSMDRPPKSDELLAAIALTWFDEAVANPQSALSLLTEATAASRIAGFSLGWDCRNLEEREQRQLGATKRHAENRAKRKALIAEFQARDFRSKDQAASELSNEFGVAWRTAREYLKGI